VSGAVWESRSRWDDNFIPAADILVHAELKVGFPVLRHLYFSVYKEQVWKQHGSFVC
jgi:hypothetical protein